MKKQLSLFLCLIFLCSAFPIYAAEGTLQPTLSVGSVHARAGESFTVDILLHNNPGFGGMDFSCFFGNALELTAIEHENAIAEFTVTPVDRANLLGNVHFAYGATENAAGDGLIARLTFTVRESTPVGDYPLTLSVAADSTFTYDGQTERDFSLQAISGSVAVIDYIPGDADQNGVVNLRDAAIILQYCADWEVSIDTDAADVDANGKVNIRDAVRILQYLAGWDVTLGESLPKPEDPPVDPEDPPVDPEDPPVDPEDPPVDPVEPVIPEHEGELFAMIVSLNMAEDAGDIATVTVTGNVHMDIAATDLGIDIATARKADYIGKYMHIYTDCAAEDFADKYNVDADESDATILAAILQKMTTVNNVAAENIRYDADKMALTLGAEKFDLNTYKIVVEQGTFDVEDFIYTTKDGYIADSDRYVIVEYFVEEKTVDDETVKTLHVYVSNVIFAQYVERTIQSNETGKDEKFVVLGYICEEETTNIEGKTTYVVEKTLGKNYTLTENTVALSKLNGHASRTVEVEGEAVASGDFAWVNYNSVDNVLTIVRNVGPIQTGRLTAHTYKETVKINGITYAFGFAANKAGLTEFDSATVKGYISALESGKDNVQYILADGKIVWLAACGDVALDDTTFPFVILGMDGNRPDTELLAPLLGKKEIKDSELLDGFYFVNGAIAVPVMDTKIGEWKIAYVGTVVNSWNAEDEEFDNAYNVSKLEFVLDLYCVEELPAKQRELYDAVTAVFAEGPIFAAVEDADGVYTIAAKADFVPSAASAQGLIFSDSSAKTNYITADPDAKEGKRVTLNDDTVIIAINGNTVMSRVGIQSAKYSLPGVATFYAAGADLIVLVTDCDLYTCANGGKWNKGKAFPDPAQYYIALDNEGAEYEVDVDGTFTLTVYNVFDVAAMEVVDKVVVTGDAEDYRTLVKPILDGIEMGTLLALEDDVLSICDDDLGDILAALFEYDTIDVSDIEFKDADTLSGILGLTAANALDKINVTVATLNLTGLGADEYDFDDLCLAADYYEEDGVTPAFKGTTEYAISDDFSGVVYEIAGDMVEEIAEPTEGVFDQYIIDALEYYVAIHAVDEEFADEDADIQMLAITMYAAANYDDDANALNLVVYKLITVAEVQ